MTHLCDRCAKEDIFQSTMSMPTHDEQVDVCLLCEFDELLGNSPKAEHGVYFNTKSTELNCDGLEVLKIGAGLVIICFCPVELATDTLHDMKEIEGGSILICDRLCVRQDVLIEYTIIQCNPDSRVLLRRELYCKCRAYHDFLPPA